MSDGLRKSVSGEEDLVFSGSPIVIGVGVKGLPGPEIVDVSGTCDIPMRTGVSGLRDPCTLGGSGVPPNLNASPRCTACMEFCGCVPVESGDEESGSRGSEGLSLGPEVGISSGVLKSSRDIRDCIESVPKERAC